MKPPPAPTPGASAWHTPAAPIEIIPPRSTPPRRALGVQLYAVAVPAIVAIAVFAISLTGMKYVATTGERDDSPPPGSAAAPVAAPNTASLLSAPPTSDTPPSASNASPASPPPAKTATADPVRFRNPFDPSEVFDFPAGTTRDEARAAVAALLIERARNRLQ
ncbi:MAG TPA: hypothetical protein VG994_04360 [Steroidobacteraceae bacterium]|nr:hypothetical protein [Steroidobacteraceae bacterium]